VFVLVWLNICEKNWSLPCWNRLERLTLDKRTSLFSIFISDEERKFYYIGFKGINVGKHFFLVTEKEA
jgi:hypothetical protein